MSTTHPLTDVLVIGSGASGGAVSWRLAEAGFRVVCLEQGRWVKPEEHPVLKADWEALARTDWAFDPNVRGWPEDYPVNNDDSPIKPLMFNAVGGSTIHWTAHTPRFHPSDFRVKTQDGVADDWPLDYFELEPYYDLNDEMMGCSGISGDPANPPRSPRQMPPLSLGHDGIRMAKAFDRLGWHWWPSDSYVNSTDYRGRQSCNHCGPVGWGCPRGAKGSTNVTYWPLAIKLGAELRSRARVFEVTTGPDGRATGARYFDASGEIHHQPARAVILACNGIGTPRLMLLSKSDCHPRGIANSSGFVGRNLMYHPYAGVTGYFRDGEPTNKGILANILMCQEFYETDPRRGFVRGYTYQMGRSSGPVSCATGGVPWGARHHEEFSERFGRSNGFGVIGEDLPELHNRVELDDALKDSHGIPAPRVHYTLSENSRRLLDHGIKNACTVLMEAGAHKTTVTPLIINGGWHLMGTARMGDDPASSVVDRWGQAHGADNLFIVDGSVFVTSAAVNPTPTIQALALRTADYIRRDRPDLKG